MGQFSLRRFRSRRARMNLSWFVIVMIAGLVFFLFMHLADRSQKDAEDRLSTYRLPPGSEQN